MFLYYIILSLKTVTTRNQPPPPSESKFDLVLIYFGGFWKHFNTRELNIIQHYWKNKQIISTLLEFYNCLSDMRKVSSMKVENQICVFGEKN